MLLRSARYCVALRGMPPVMAAVAAMTIPHMHNRRLSLSPRVGLALAAVHTLPLLGCGSPRCSTRSRTRRSDNNVTHAATRLARRWPGERILRQRGNPGQRTPMVPALLTRDSTDAVSWLAWYLLAYRAGCCSACAITAPASKGG